MAYQFSPDQEAWLQALESGQYTQGAGALKQIVEDDDGNEIICYCCLGVACEIFDPNGFRDHPETDIALKGKYQYRNAGCHVIDEHIKRRVKLFSLSGIPTDGSAETLASLNDEGELTFDGIAKLLREKPELYFES